MHVLHHKRGGKLDALQFREHLAERIIVVADSWCKQVCFHLFCCPLFTLKLHGLFSELVVSLVKKYVCILKSKCGIFDRSDASHVVIRQKGTRHLRF